MPSHLCFSTLCLVPQRPKASSGVLSSLPKYNLTDPLPWLYTLGLVTDFSGGIFAFCWKWKIQTHTWNKWRKRMGYDINKGGIKKWGCCRYVVYSLTIRLSGHPEDATEVKLHETVVLFRGLVSRWTIFGIYLPHLGHSVGHNCYQHGSLCSVIQ